MPYLRVFVYLWVSLSTLNIFFCHLCVFLTFFVCLCQLQTSFAVFACLCVSLCVFARLCPSLRVFARLCIVWVSLRYLDRPFKVSMAFRPVLLEEAKGILCINYASSGSAHDINTALCESSKCSGETL